MKKIRWGVMSTARIGTETVIPAMQLGKYSRVTAIASRQLEKAQAQARKLGIKKAYGSYEELLADPDIDAVYIPLPNHLHVPWAIKALNAGKHVLCEKPIGLSAAEAQVLLDTARKFPRLNVMEAFMYRHHPQWQWAKQKVSEGKIGELRTIQTFFSYYNADPENIRNKADIGGGGLMDIGCYCISLSRFIFGAEPWRVCGIIEEDPNMKVDRLTSGILEFSRGTSTFTCATQLVPYQRVNIFGTKAGLKSKYLLTPRLTGHVKYGMEMVTGLKRLCWKFATSIRFRETCFPGQCWKIEKSRCRWKMLWRICRWSKHLSIVPEAQAGLISRQALLPNG